MSDRVPKILEVQAPTILEAQLITLGRAESTYDIQTLRDAIRYLPDKQKKEILYMNQVERIFYWDKLVYLDPVRIFKQLYSIDLNNNLVCKPNPFLALVKKP